MTKHVDVQRLREHESASLVQESRKKQKTGSKGKTGLSVCSLSSARGAAVLDQNTLDSLKVNARAPSHSLSLSLSSDTPERNACSQSFLHVATRSLSPSLSPSDTPERNAYPQSFLQVATELNCFVDRIASMVHEDWADVSVFWCTY